jgi:hypothetical protein
MGIIGIYNITVSSLILVAITLTVVICSKNYLIANNGEGKIKINTNGI